MRRLSVTVDHDTEDYNRANAKLPWYERLLARNGLTIVYSTFPSVLIVLVFLGVKAAVDAISHATSNEPGVRMSAWFVVGGIALEVATDIIKSHLDPNYIYGKPVLWVILLIVWSVSLLLTGGNLGMWSFAVWWLAWWVAIGLKNVFHDGVPVLRALFHGALYATVFLACAASVSGYIFVVSTVSGVAQVVLTGVAYPTIAHVLKELWFKVISQEMDRTSGVTENDDVENGTFISTVLMTETFLELANKIAIAQIARTDEFAGTMATSFVIEVLGKAAVMWWFKNKVVAEEVVEESIHEAGILPVIPSSRNQSEQDDRVESLKKAAHRHHNANEKKRYEFRTAYGELGEVVATVVAFGVLLAAGELQPAEGLGRLAFALVCEYLADLGVWCLMESEGYMLTNVVYRFAPVRIASLVCMTVAGLGAVELGNEMVWMAVLNANVTLGNGTANGTMIA